MSQAHLDGTPAPIHSDPAGEENTLKRELQETTILLRKEISNSYQLKEEIRLLKEQTGRTYTEGERDEFALGFANFCLDWEVMPNEHRLNTYKQSIEIIIKP